MKFFHMADLHIGLKLYNRDLYSDQANVLRQAVAAAADEQPDAVIIAGDIYDKAVPPAEAVELFDKFISELTMAVPGAEIMIISGNHDSAARINLFRNILKHQKVHMIGEPPKLENEKIEKLTLQDEYGSVNFYLLPFVKPSYVSRIVGCDENGNNLSYDQTLHKLIERENIDTSVRNVLVSHQFYLPAGSSADEIERMDSEIRTVGNIDEVRSDVLEKFDYAALGHIHKPMKVGNEFYRYSGTPLAYSVSEAGQQKGIIVVEMFRKGIINTRVIPLKPPHEVRVIKGELNEVLLQGCDDYVLVIITDRKDLDVIDMNDRLRNAFPNLLSAGRNETVFQNDIRSTFSAEKVPDPFELCCEFLKDPDREDMDLLLDVINTVQGSDER